MDCTKDACNKLRTALKGLAELDGKAMRDFFKQNTVETHYNASNAKGHSKTDYSPSNAKGHSKTDYSPSNAKGHSKTDYNASNAKGHSKTDYNPSLRVQPIGKVGKEKVSPIRICDANAEALAKLNQTLTLKAYSPNTIRTYVGEFSVFLQTLGNTTAESLDMERIKDYLFYCHTTLKLSENTIHSRMNALKFYYEQVLDIMSI